MEKTSRLLSKIGEPLKKRSIPLPKISSILKKTGNPLSRIRALLNVKVGARFPRPLIAVVE
jgi:hypothetical protein